MTTLYNLSSKYWDGDVLSFRCLSPTGDIFATIPVDFMIRGEVNTWRFVLDILDMLVATALERPASVQGVDGSAGDMTLPPVAGQYVYIFQREWHLPRRFTRSVPVRGSQWLLPRPLWARKR